MNILEALAQSQQAQQAQKDQGRVIMPDGLLSISDAVFLCALHRLGLAEYDAKEWLENPPREREQILQQIEGRL